MEFGLFQPLSWTSGGVEADSFLGPLSELLDSKELRRLLTEDAPVIPLERLRRAFPSGGGELFWVEPLSRWVLHKQGVG